MALQNLVWKHFIVSIPVVWKVWETLWHLIWCYWYAAPIRKNIWTSRICITKVAPMVVRETPVWAVPFRGKDKYGGTWLHPAMQDYMKWAHRAMLGGLGGPPGSTARTSLTKSGVRIPWHTRLSLLVTCLEI
jgi:hypothetical protein